MRKILLTFLPILFVCGVLGYCGFSIYDGYVNQPHGKWQGWGQIYSEKEKCWIQYDKYENGYFRDLDNTGNPFDRQKYPRYTPLSDEYRKLIEEQNERWRKKIHGD